MVGREQTASSMWDT